MTTASRKETVEEQQEPKGPLAKFGEIVEDIVEKVLDKKKPDEPNPKGDPKPDPKPDPCCGPNDPL